MARKTIYICDSCGKKIGEPYGALHLTMRSDTEPQVNGSGEVCSIECAKKWIGEQRCYHQVRPSWYK